MIPLATPTTTVDCASMVRPGAKVLICSPRQYRAPCDRFYSERLIDLLPKLKRVVASSRRFQIANSATIHEALYTRSAHNARGREVLTFGGPGGSRVQHRTLRKLAYRFPGKLMRASNLLPELRDVLPRTNDTSRYFSDHSCVRSALDGRKI
jgi:hypothetical protein